VTVVPSLKVVAKHGETAIRDAVATVGFTPAEELQHPFEGHTELYFRSALPEAYFGRGGLRVQGWIRTTKMSGRCWVLNVDAVVFNPGIEVVRDRTDDQDRHRPWTVTDTLRGLTERVLKLNDHREFSASFDHVEKGACQIANQLEENFAWWYGHFATVGSTYDYMARGDTRMTARNFYSGLILALQNNNQEMIDLFVRLSFFYSPGVRHRPDFYTSAAARCRRIGDVFGVELSLPSWERLQATRN